MLNVNSVNNHLHPHIQFETFNNVLNNSIVKNQDWFVKMT